MSRTYTDVHFVPKAGGNFTVGGDQKERSTKHSIYRIFNYALSQDEVSKLYNFGRPDKYEIGNEYKNITTKPFSEDVKSKSYDLNVAPKYISYQQGVGNVCFPNNKVYSFKLTLSEPSDIPPNIFGVQGNGGNPYYNVRLTKVSDTVYVGSGVIDVKGISRFIENKLDGLSRTLEISEALCIAEYLPSSLTPTSWRDTSGQVNNLSVVTPVELDYSEPCEERIEGDAPPTIIPDFKGQIFADNTAKVSYEAWGTTSAADWKAR